MEEKPSKRLVDQRLRNRIMEAVSVLALGDDGVRREGFVEYFDTFYDFILHRGHAEMYPNNSISLRERELLSQLRNILNTLAPIRQEIQRLRILAPLDGQNGYNL